MQMGYFLGSLAYLPVPRIGPSFGAALRLCAPLSSRYILASSARERAKELGPGRLITFLDHEILRASN